MVKEASKMLLQKIKLGKSLLFIYVLRSFTNASASCSGCEAEVLLVPAVRRGWHTQGYNNLAAMLWSCVLFAVVDCFGMCSLKCEGKPAPLSHRLVLPESTLKWCGRVVVGDKLVTWLCKQRYWYCKLTPTVKYSYEPSAVRALGMPRSHCAHVCNIEVQFRRISFICVPQAAGPSYFFKVPGELLLMQRIISAAEV